MFTDEHLRTVWEQIRQHDLRAFAHILQPELFGEAAKQAGANLGNSALGLVNLVWLGVASAVHRTHSFAGILCLTLKLLEDASGWHSTPLAAARRNAQRRKSKRSKHDPHGQDPTILSEEAFVKARQRMPLGFWVALIVLLGDLFEVRHLRWVSWKGFRLLALDGTHVNLPSWKRLADHFGTAKNGKGAPATQARMVMLQLPLVRLPWRYELCPLSEGERTVAGRLLQQLRPKDLVLMDRGFWSYGLFWQVQDHRAFFAIRLVRGVRFRTLRRLGSKDRLVRWSPSSRRWKKGPWPASMDLRVIDYQIKGFRPSAVVTNVLDPRRISRDEWVRLATESEPGRYLDQGLYHRRWEIETTFCELKVRQGMEGSLRSRTPPGIAYEVAGHVLLYLLVRWLMVEAAESEGVDPLRVSFINALRELSDMSQTLVTASPQRVARILLPRLLARIASHQVPFRPGRHYPRPQDTKIGITGKGRIRLPSKLAPIIK